MPATSPFPPGPRPGRTRLFEIGSVTKVFTGLLLAHAVIEGELTLDTPVGNLAFGDLVTERITQPLALLDTVVPRQRADEQRRRTAAGHHFRRTPAPPWPVDGLPGAGALLSTATDLMMFAHAHLVPPEGALGEAIRLALTQHARGIGLAWQLTSGHDGSRLA